jgi:hypothetical protein
MDFIENYTYSNKPLLITIRDGFFLSLVALIVYAIILIFYYFKFGDSIFTYGNLRGAIEQFVVSMLCQFIYEYSSINAMVAESSVRYSKGSTLEKYTSRRHAILHKLYSNKVSKERDEEKLRLLKNNMIILSLAISQPKLMRRIIAAIGEINSANDTEDTNKDTNKEINKDNIDDKIAQILAKINKNKNHISSSELKVLLSVPFATLGEIPYILEDMDEDVIEDILLNGFDEYVPKDNAKSLYKKTKLAIQDFGEIRLYNRLKEKIKQVKKDKLTYLNKALESATPEDIILEYGNKEELISRITHLRDYLGE